MSHFSSYVFTIHWYIITDNTGSRGVYDHVSLWLPRWLQPRLQLCWIHQFRQYPVDRLWKSCYAGTKKHLITAVAGVNLAPSCYLHLQIENIWFSFFVKNLSFCSVHAVRTWWRSPWIHLLDASSQIAIRLGHKARTHVHWITPWPHPAPHRSCRAGFRGVAGKHPPPQGISRVSTRYTFFRSTAFRTIVWRDICWATWVISLLKTLSLLPLL